MKTNKMINLNRRKFLKFILVAAGFLGLTKLVGHKLINSASAWSEPTLVPPGANVPAPINVGTTAQHKNGEIGATRFVDRDNTAWFVDPAGTTFLNGPVGIGTTSPATNTRLHVTAGHETSQIRLHADNATNPHAHLALWASEPGVTWTGTGIGNNVRWQNVAGTWGPRLIDTTRAGAYIRYIDNTTIFGAVGTNNVDVERMRLAPDGNVGIGTTSPTHRLHVVGTGSIDTLHAPTRLRIPVGTNMFS